MSKKSKSKGYAYEKELVDQAKNNGFIKTKRAWGSNGRSLGWDEEVDIVVQKDKGFPEFPVQAKRRRVIPAYLTIPEGCEAVAVRSDRDSSMVLISWHDYLEFCRLRSCEQQAQ